MGRTSRRCHAADSASKCGGENKMRGWRKKLKRSLKHSAKNKHRAPKQVWGPYYYTGAVSHSRNLNNSRDADCTIDEFKIPWKGTWKASDMLGMVEGAIKTVQGKFVQTPETFTDATTDTGAVEVTKEEKRYRMNGEMPKGYEPTGHYTRDCCDSSYCVLGSECRCSLALYLRLGILQRASVVYQQVRRADGLRVPEDEVGMVLANQRHPRYLAASAKQLRRRGKLKLFTGHRQKEGRRCKEERCVDPASF